MLYGTLFILLVSVKTFQVLFSYGVTNGLKEDLWHFYYVLGYFQYQENYTGKIEIFKRWFEVRFWAKSLVEAFGLENLILLILSRLICCTPVITWKLYCNDGSLLPLQAAEGWMLLPWVLCVSQDWPNSIWMDKYCNGISDSFALILLL